MVYEGDGVEGDCGAGDVDGANLQVAGGQARDVDGPPGVLHTQQRQAEQKGQEHPDQAKGGHEWLALYQGVLELVVAGEGCEGTQAEQGTSNLAAARVRWRARSGGPVWS